MDFTSSDIALRVRSTRADQSASAFKKIFASDPGFLFQLMLCLPLIAAGAVLHLNAIQWILVGFVTILFLVAGVFRTASLLQIRWDTSITEFHATRIRCMGNALVTITAGLSLITYMFVFVPRILVML